MTLDELEVLKIKKRRNIVLLGLSLALGFYILYMIYMLILGVIFELNIVVLRYILGFGLNLIYFILIFFLIIFLPPLFSTEKFKYAYKKFFVENLLYQTFDDVTYSPQTCINEGYLQRAFGISSYSKSDDYVSGRYNNIKFEQADVRIWRRCCNSADKVFTGKWMTFDFNRNFKSKILVYQKGIKDANNIYMENISMESMEFNESFYVFSEDKLEAFYILTPCMIEKIMRLKEISKGKIVMFFTDTKLHIGIDNGKNAFECSVWRKINKEREIEKISSDLKIILAIIDELTIDSEVYLSDKKGD